MNNRLLSKSLLVLILSATIGFISSCEEKEEILALAKAQKCLDELPTSIDPNWNSPIACAEKVEKFNTQQANIIKCAAYLTAGGLDTDRIVNAAKKLDDGTDQQAIYIAALTLNKPDNATGLTRANTAKAYCNATGVGAFKYLGNLAVMGTTLSNIGTNFPADPTTATPAEIQTAIDNCQASTTCISSIADSAATIADSYCDTASKDDDVCKEINTAIDATGGDTTKIGSAMLCYLEGRKVVGTNCCNQDGTTNCVAL